MTEDEWMNGDDWRAMLAFLSGKSTGRKVILYECAALRQIWHLLYDSASQQAVEVAEEAVDGRKTLKDIEYARWCAESPTFGFDFDPAYIRSMTSQIGQPSKVTKLIEMGVYTHDDLQRSDRSIGDAAIIDQLQNAARIAESCVWSCEATEWLTDTVSISSRTCERWASQSEWPGAWLVREIFGNPFRPVSIPPEWLTWDGGTVPAIADGIYEQLAFARMPILADALEDAGCEDVAILDHCRQPGRHARGCWVIDALLGLK